MSNYSSPFYVESGLAVPSFGGVSPRTFLRGYWCEHSWQATRTGPSVSPSHLGATPLAVSPASGEKKKEEDKNTGKPGHRGMSVAVSSQLSISPLTGEMVEAGLVSCD